MMRAYSESYLTGAMRNIGNMFDYAINTMGLPGSAFVDLFCGSEISLRMQNGEAKYLIGKSGVELAIDVVEETTGHLYQPDLADNFDRSADYWCGWSLCYYQWYTCCTYTDIFRFITYEELISSYVLLHEADLSKFVDTINDLRRIRFYETNLKRMRSAYGCSQSELSNKSGVSLRSIQMYEQRNKDINKAQAETILRLAKALGCSMESLYEA